MQKRSGKVVGSSGKVVGNKWEITLEEKKTPIFAGWEQEFWGRSGKRSGCQWK